MNKGETSKTLVKNTTMLYIMNITKIILPLVTLPYLTRVLSKDCYGVVSYVKAVMQYMQIVVDFGFLLSATKDIVKVQGDKKAISEVVGDTLVAKLILVLVAFISLLLMIAAIPMLRSNALYTILSFVVVALTCFLMDFLFRGIEEMHVITLRYVLMRAIAAILTFVVVKSDDDMMWIPCLDIIGSILAVILVFIEMKKRGIEIKVTGLKNAFQKLKDSAIFFLSNMATTTFTALNTLMIGLFINTEQVAEWSVCMQMVSAVQSMYSPITDGIYPQMVKDKNWKLVEKTAKVFMSIVAVGCIFTFVVAKYALLIIGGEKYVTAVPLLRAFIPLLFFSFPSILFGWPALGAIGKEKETTLTTVITAFLQIGGLLALLLIGQFNVINLALLRGFTEACMFAMRYRYCRKFKGEFAI